MNDLLPLPNQHGPQLSQIHPDHTQVAAPNPLLGRWLGQQQVACSPFDPSHLTPQNMTYQYSTVRQEMGQQLPATQPEAYRLPSLFAQYHSHPASQPVRSPEPKPRQRTPIACQICRKKKVRCSGYESSPDGRCLNCVRYNRQCLFRPISLQAAFVPASTLYGPHGRAPLASPDDNYPSSHNGGKPPMLYGAYGQPLGRVGLYNQLLYSETPPPLQNPQAHAYPPFDRKFQRQMHDRSRQARTPENRLVLKRSFPDTNNGNPHAFQSPCPKSKPRLSLADSNGNDRYSRPNLAGFPLNWPPAAVQSDLSYPEKRYNYYDGPQKGRVSSIVDHTPNPPQDSNSSCMGPDHRDARSDDSQSALEDPSANGRRGMKIEELLRDGNQNGRHLKPE